MQKIRAIVHPIQIVSLIGDAVMMTYIVLYFYWIFFVENMETHILTELFVKLNPMTWGTYLMGLTMLLHFVAFKNIIGRCLLATLYGFAVVVSLIAIMGMTSWGDFMIYAPNIIIVALAVIILYRQHIQKE